MRFSAIAVLAACVGTLLLTGCAPTRYKLDMTQYEQYDHKYSYARNLARLQGYDRALTDTKVPKDMVSDWGAVGLGADLLVDNWLYNINPSMPGSFGVGAGIKILQSLTAPPKIGEYDAMCAFVPVSVAKTELDARDYIIDQMIKAFEATAKDQKHELLKKSEKPEHYNEKAKPCEREIAWQVVGGAYLGNESLGCGKQASNQCFVGVRLEKNTEPQQPAPVPAWIDPDQPLAWFFPRILVLSNLQGVDYDKRDEVRYQWLTAWAKHFPENTLMYVSPAKKDGKRTPPFYTDGKKAWFFVIPKEE